MIALVDRIARFAARHEMFRPGDRTGVAVSGGSDSVFLLYALRELAPRWNLQLSVLHVEHGIRGEASLADAEFVRSLAEQFELPFHLHSARVSTSDGNLEQAARQARIGFYRELLESGRLDRIATGHTRSDQAETVLYRVLRGSGLAGLAGILPIAEPGLVRPLLELTRSEIQDWLCQHGIAWREDETNQDRSFARNRLRHEVLPLLKECFNPRLEEALADLATLARDEESFWSSYLTAAVETGVVGISGPQPEDVDPVDPASGDLGSVDLNCGARTRACPVLTHGDASTQTDPPLIIPITTLTTVSTAVSRRKIRHLIQSIKGDLRQIEFAHVERILEMSRSPEGHDRVQIPGVDIFRSFEWLRFSKLPAHPTERDFSLPLPAPGFAELPGMSIRITLQMQEKRASSDAYVTVMNELDLDRLRPADGAVPILEVRNWRPGDKYRPVGRSQEEKIKVLFQEDRIPLWDRRHWPIITYNGIILWTRRFGVAADFAPSPGARVVLRIDESG
jgi:tRNA(Ile)-lysidine synthase